LRSEFDQHQSHEQPDHRMKPFCSRVGRFATGRFFV
jgi:hypothetical protein